METIVGLLLLANTCFGGDSLWPIQQTLAGKKYVDSTHEFTLLTNLDQVPKAGAIVVVSSPKAKGGSGFPARVFAIVP